MGRDLLGILIAGGRGTRLGFDRPKALVEVAGRTLLDRALATLEPCATAIVIVAPAARGLPAPAHTPAGVPVRIVHDADEGPLGGVAAALRAGLFARALVLGVDFPLLRPETLAALAARLDYAGVVDAAPPAVIPAPDGILQPLAAAYGWSAIGALADAYEAGERSIVRAAGALGARRLEPAELASLPGGVESFFNVNTPQDLAAVERRLAGREGG